MLSGYTDWGVETMLSGTQIGELRQCYEVHRLALGRNNHSYQVHRLGS